MMEKNHLLAFQTAAAQAILNTSLMEAARKTRENSEAVTGVEHSLRKIQGSEYPLEALRTLRMPEHVKGMVGDLVTNAKDPAKVQEFIDIALGDQTTEVKRKLMRAIPLQTTDHDVATAALTLVKLSKIEEKRKVDALVATLNGYKEWGRNHKIQANDCSRYHKAIEAITGGMFYDSANMEFFPANAKLKEKWQVENIFVVKHDWAAVLEEAMKADDEIRLPFPKCAFEFRVDNKTVIVIASERGEGETTFSTGIGATAFFEGSQGVWIAFHEHGVKVVCEYLWLQIKAICIALEAKVAEHEVQRAPEKLNKKRIEAGKIPINSYHLVDLSRRIRARHKGDTTPTGRKVRMHFRRGHWRHFENHKTWIEWMLVGDPDLGFIDKMYKI